MRALLDVNVLIALLDAGHIHHHLATSWLETEIHHGWASCPITQNGCIRIMSQPNYPASLPVLQVAERLSEAASSAEHEFWPADSSLLNNDSVDWQRIMGHRQITDAYLLTLAVRHSGRFITLDKRIDSDFVRGAKPEQLIVLTAN